MLILLVLLANQNCRKTTVLRVSLKVITKLSFILSRLIFKHRVITKAKLGRNVVFDMGKFKVR